MIERVLGHLADHGIEEAVLSLGYRPDAFTDAYPEGTIAGVRALYAVEPNPLDTAGAIRFAAGFGAVDETFVVLNGDVLTDFDITDLITFHRRRGAEGSHRAHAGRRSEQFRCRPHRRAGPRSTAFIEKPAPGEAPTNLINAGFYVLEPSVLDRIATGMSGCPSSGRPSRRWWPTGPSTPTVRTPTGLDTGAPDAYLGANRDLPGSAVVGRGRRHRTPPPIRRPGPAYGRSVRWTWCPARRSPGRSSGAAAHRSPQARR